MALQHIIDSHMHLFNGGIFGLMAKNSISNYQNTITNAQSSCYQIDGFVFIETGQTARPGNDIQTWAAGPLGELSFLKGIIEGTSATAQLTGSKNGDLLKGIVAWAPIDRGVETFQEYLKVAEITAGKETWSRVKGFRYLLQGIRTEQKFKAFVEDPAVVETLRAFGEAYSFDVGVDQHHGGIWQLERVAGLIEEVSNSTKTRFVLNHLCKPDLTQLPATDKQKQDFARWKSVITRMSRLDNVYIKVSGAFSEMGFVGTTANPMPVEKIADRIAPWFDHAVQSFTPKRMMYGSDWPLVSMSGPGDKGWALWKAVVAELLIRSKLSEADEKRIWAETAVETYRLKI